MNLASTNGTLSASTTTAFRATYGNTWRTLCYITNNPGEFSPGDRDHLRQRDGGERKPVLRRVFRFTAVGPCLAIAAVQTGPPYQAGQTSVTVSNVSGSATAVTVYKKTGTGAAVQIGQKTSSIVAGNNSVTVTALVKSDQVLATQTIGGQEGCLPSAGAYVGGGANPKIRVSLLMRQSGLYTGPIGASGTATTYGLYFTPGTGTGNPPAGGTVVNPSGCWQTVKIDPRTAGQTGVWAGSWPGQASPDTLPWVGLEGIALHAGRHNGCGAIRNLHRQSRQRHHDDSQLGRCHRGRAGPVQRGG